MEDKNHLHSMRNDRTEENVNIDSSRPPEVGEQQDFFSANFQTNKE